MADRKRKRKSPAGPPKSPSASASNGSTAPAPAQRPAPGDGKEMMRRGYARAEEKNVAVRKALEPLRPGERPGIVVATVAWLALIAVVMAYNAIASSDLDNGSRVGNGFMIVLIAIAGIGTWRLAYWAILGTETLLALTVISLVLAAMVLTNVLLVLLAVLAAGISGYLFMKMIKVMARVQKAALVDRGELDAD